MPRGEEYANDGIVLRGDDSTRGDGVIARHRVSRLVGASNRYSSYGGV